MFDAHFYNNLLDSNILRLSFTNAGVNSIHGYDDVEQQKGSKQRNDRNAPLAAATSARDFGARRNYTHVLILLLIVTRWICRNHCVHVGESCKAYNRSARECC
jgi:hypothetical protein